MFKIGDVVVLKSGGPDMTVEEPGEVVGCVWFEKNQPQRGFFPAAVLEAKKPWNPGVG
jgi:uncharacterized protein YodC (DUF2158 family)